MHLARSPAGRPSRGRESSGAGRRRTPADGPPPAHQSRVGRWCGGPKQRARRPPKCGTDHPDGGTCVQQGGISGAPRQQGAHDPAGQSAAPVM